MQQTLKVEAKDRVKWKELLRHPIFINQSTIFVNYQVDFDLEDEFEMYNNKQMNDLEEREHTS